MYWWSVKILLYTAIIELSKEPSYKMFYSIYNKLLNSNKHTPTSADKYFAKYIKLRRSFLKMKH